MEAIKRLPCYISTIIFRVMSISLTMAYLRIWATIPLTLLVIELTYFAWNRNKKREVSLPKKLIRTYLLVTSNLTVMNARTIHELKEEEQEEKSNIEQFLKNSSLITFFHHSITLLIILFICLYHPQFFVHWTEPHFWLKPSIERFYWVFGITLLMGVYSLTVILYRIRHISSANIHEDEKIELIGC